MSRCCSQQPACCSSWMFARTAVTSCNLSCIPPIAWVSVRLQTCTPVPTSCSRPTLMQVFEAVISWINYEKETRLEHMAKLMEHVRLPLLPRDYLVQTVEEEALIKNNNTCKDFLIEAMKYHLLPLDQRLLIKNPRTKPRTPVSLPKVMIVVGGQAPKAIRSVECYDFEEDRWDQIAELPSRRCRAGVVFMAGHVYAVGGFNGSLRVRTVDVYDGVKDQWTSIASMQERRSTLGAAVLNDLLYAVGGFDGSTGLASVEAYSYKTNEWFFVAPMNTRRSSVGVGVVEGKLYAVGGYDGASRQCLSTVEQYNPATNEWTYVADMSTRRSGAGVGVLSGQLYATGGHDGPLVRKSVEVYDPGTNTWKQVADMNMCRRNAGVCAVNGLLYVVGGDDGSCNLASVEYYNPVADKWTLLPSNMSTGRSYAVMGDEKWILYNNVEWKRSWGKRNEPPPTTPKAGLHPKKVMLCIWSDWKGVFYYELLLENQTINSNKYCSQLDQLKAALDEKPPELVNRKCIIFHQDNARPHVSLVTRQKLLQYGW
ncbi:kelch-like protein 3 isoform X10 [Kogia breviceps]|uniref:kelch-like protein 3 isoform X10 n=1 Tax=Kogia breviceps TaxID=27615 RepID=UPI0034D30333